MNKPSFRINAYLLAADPTWIESSVLSYYDLVEEITVSYDETHTSWSGTRIPVEECLHRLRAIDVDNKMRYCPGRYARTDFTPMENDTHQRQKALEQAGAGADWVLELDTDEVLPDVEALVRVLAIAEERGIPAVEWPMRTLYRRLSPGRYLEVCASNGADRFEYPGPIASRPYVTKCDARRVRERFLRPAVHGDEQSLQIRQDPQSNEVRLALLTADQAILHNSWGRSPAGMRSKIASWSHSGGWRSWLYYYSRWIPSAYAWRIMRDFHPFARGLWPALKPCKCIPKALSEEAV